MLTKTKVLAISKDTTMLRLLEQELNNAYYEVASTQQTGVSLREVLNCERPDFIVLDIMMPNLDGIEVCLYLRQWTQIPIMMLSTWGTGNGMLRGLNLGSDSYLTEPFGIDELKARINETLKRNAVAKEPTMSIHTSMS